MSDTTTPNLRRAVNVGFGLLGGWICVPEDATPEEQEQVMKDLYQGWGFPDNLQGDLSLVRDRLFGGFACAETGRSHVYVAMGRYTYTGTHNSPLTPDERVEQFKELIDYDNGHNGFHGRGPFTNHAPALAS